MKNYKAVLLSAVSFLPISSLVLLNGCVEIPNTSSVLSAPPVVPTQDQVKDWETAIIGALSNEAQANINNGKLSGSNAVVVTHALNSAKSNLHTLNSGSPGLNWQQITLLILQDIKIVLPLLPLPANVSIGIQAGVAVLLAFINNMSISVPSVPNELRAQANQYHWNRPLMLPNNR